MCQVKEVGGLGLNDLYLMNLAFWAKQAWPIKNESESILSKTLQNKYFFGTELFSVTKKNCSKSL